MGLICIDTETGGFDPRNCALLSVALVELDKDLNPMRDLEVFIQPYPGKVIEEQAAKVNGFSTTEWYKRGALPIHQAIETIKMWMPYNPEAIAHNAGFDRAFMEAAEEMTGLSLYLGYAWECTAALFRSVGRAYDFDFKKANLDFAARYVGHWSADYQRGTHSAGDDAKACAAIYKWCINRMRQGVMGQRELPLGLSAKAS